MKAQVSLPAVPDEKEPRYADREQGTADSVRRHIGKGGLAMLVGIGGRTATAGESRNEEDVV